MAVTTVTTAYVVRFDRVINDPDLIEDILTGQNAFLDHVGFTIEVLWKDPGPDVAEEEVLYEEQ